MKRTTRQRTAILSLLGSVDNHPTAQWIYDQLRPSLASISLGTVYRNLSELAAEGTILRLDIGDETARYDATATPHCHFCCTACAGVFDAPLDDVDMQLLYGQITALGFTPQRHALYIYGLCPACAQPADPQTTEKPPNVKEET